MLQEYVNYILRNVTCVFSNACPI